MFREALPIVIRNHIADLPFNKNTYKDVFNKADQVFDSNNGSEPIPNRQVSAIKASKPTPSAPANAEVAAVQRSQGGQKNKNKNKNQGQNQSNNGGQKNKNQESSNSNQGSAKKSVNDDGLCKMHAKWKENANFCLAPWACRMKDTWKAPQWSFDKLDSDVSAVSIDKNNKIVLL